LHLISKIQRYWRIIYNKTNKSFFMDYKSQIKILNSFRNPVSLTERSYFQYKCQMSEQFLILKIVQNFIAIFLLVYYLLKPYKKPILNDTSDYENIAVLLREGIAINTIPISLQDEYDKIYECNLIGDILLTKNDKEFISNRIRKYWYAPLFCLKCIVKLGIYSNVINIYPTKAIITHNEYSFASSFLTDYCHFQRVEHINIMHGEKLYDIHDSFVSFDRYYVWDQHYVDLLVSLGADENQFIIEEPSVLHLNNTIKKETEYELTYYLGGQIASLV
jgi:hypothetical protein